MKKLVCLIMVSFSLGFMFTGCSGIPEGTPPVNDTDLREDENALVDIGNQDGLLVEVEPRLIYINEMPRFVRLTIQNLSSAVFQGGLHYVIEHHNGVDWLLVVAPPVADEELIIAPSETFVMEFVQLMPDAHRYVAGRYRVRFGYWYSEFSIYE